MKMNHQFNGSVSDTNPSQVWLDKQDILQRMHVSSSTLQKWRKKKLLPYSRLGRKIYYLESDVQKMLENARVEEEKSGKKRPRAFKRK
jgi:hypothetical protein